MNTPSMEMTQPSHLNLWQNPSFVRLWIAKTVSGVGSSITATAVPLTATMVLGATPGQMAMLVFAGQLPDLLFGLLAGAWVDRRRRRPLLIGTDIGRALLLMLIPLGAFLDFLNMSLLWIVAFGSAALTLVFALASVAVLPSIVRQDQLVDANSKLHMSEAVLALAGPGLAGALIQMVTAPRAIIADVVSYIVSAFSLGGMTTREADPEYCGDGFHAIRAEIAEGLRALMNTPLLRALAISMGVMVVGGAINQTVIMLFMINTLGFSPFTIGLVAASTGVGALTGAVFAQRVARTSSVGGAIIAAGFLQAGALMIVPTAAYVDVPAAILVAASLLSGLGYSVLSINQISLRQRITPIHMLGRVTAARRFLIFCMGPFGAAAGGWIGTAFGLEAALLTGGIVTLGASIYMWHSPIKTAT